MSASIGPDFSFRCCRAHVLVRALVRELRLDDLPVFELDDPIAEVEIPVIVRDDDDGVAAPREPLRP